MDCFGTYFTHVQTCDNVRVQSAMQWTASAHTLRMSKPVMTFVFKVLYGMDSFGTYFPNVQTCDNVRVQSATEWTASVHTFTHVQTRDNVRVQSATQWTASVPTLHMSKPVTTFVFKVLRNGLLRYILYTCPNLWQRSCSKCYAMDCFGTYFTHVQTSDNVRVQGATQWTASVHTLHMSKPVITFVFKVLYGMDCFRTYFTHVQTCENVRVQSATQWTASVHTLHMSKPVITFVFKVLRNGLLRHILYTCPNLW